MKIPFEWLKEYVDIGVGLDEVCASLTRVGLEIEGVEHGEGGAVLEVNVTPNRPDCLNLFGVARELSAAHGWPLRLPDTSFNFAEQAPDVQIEIVDQDLCHRYAARVVEGVQIGPSPDWMVRRLEQVGVRPINNVVDITNYVLMELGHPMHAFDMGRLTGNRIIVARASKGEVLVTLDGVERSMESHYLTIRDGSGPIALAGVMGGLNTEVHEGTSRILLESAWFFPASIRRTSRETGLSSESSYRFERGTDIEGLITALDRATSLFVSLAGGRVMGPRIDTYPTRFSPSRISLTGKRLGNLLGFELPLDRVKNILECLSFRVDVDGKDALSVEPPTFRRDVERDTDLVEEAARIHGYDKIPSRLPAGIPPAPQPADRRGFAKEVKTLMRKSGFSEAVNFSFMNPDHLEFLKLGDGDLRRNVVHLLNPLRKEEGILRSTLVPALFENTSLNLRRGADGVRLFEVSRVFRKRDEAGLPHETSNLGAVYAPSVAKELYSNDVPTFFILKGAIESLALHLGFQSLTFRPLSSQPFLTPGQASDVVAGGDVVGFIGRVLVDVLEGFDIEREVIVCELNLDSMFKSFSKSIQFRPLARYPFVDRDISMVVPSALTAAEIGDAITQSGESLVVRSRVFDVYSGKGIPEGRKSLAFSVRYQSPERTLTVEEVDSAHARLTENLKRTFPVEIRGL